MKKINILIQQIEKFMAIAEMHLTDKYISREHALDRVNERTDNKRLVQESMDYVLQIIYKIQNNKELFEKIPPGSKWTIDAPGNLKAVVEKIFENGQFKFILKTFLKPNMAETGVWGSLEEYLKSTVNESLTKERLVKIQTIKRSIKALEKLLEKSFPLNLEQVKKNNSPEFWNKILGLTALSKNGIITKEQVENYKNKLVNELEKLLTNP